MPRVSGQLTTFPIHPEPGQSPLYYTVRIFSGEDTLRNYLKRRPAGGSLGQRGHALCTTWDHRTATGELLPDLGELLLTCRALGSETISHECAHAAIGWARRIGLRPFPNPGATEGHAYVSPDEERYCTALGHLVKQLVEQLHVRHLVV